MPRIDLQESPVRRGIALCPLRCRDGEIWMWIVGYMEYDRRYEWI